MPTPNRDLFRMTRQELGWVVRRCDNYIAKWDFFFNRFPRPKSGRKFKAEHFHYNRAMRCVKRLRARRDLAEVIIVMGIARDQ